jgi:phosphoribosylaminoimidazolecarboxamide formyltransferase/IMP cyclohydrolase
MAKIERALISVTDKRGVAALARALADLGVEIISTGGTARLLADAGVPVVPIHDVTGFPEMLDGRVKTLHPKIHGALLGRRDLAEHRQAMAAHGIRPIDLVVVNLYRFEETAAAGADLAEAVENIDIGGPSMIRSAAKNHASVTVVVDPDDYDALLGEMKASGGAVSAATNFRFAKKAFALTARYDGAIADYLGTFAADGHRVRYGDTLHLDFIRVQNLRYGENPHQTAALYRERSLAEPCIPGARQPFEGKELSFNNIVDANAALELVREFEETAAVVIKHTNPCGVATSRTSLADAFRKARACDPVSIFGGIVAFNRAVDEETARELTEIFLEVIVAPGFRPEALARFQATPRAKNVRLLEVATLGARAEGKSANAEGKSANAEGKSANAEGKSANAEGKSAKAEEKSAHAEEKPADAERRGLDLKHVVGGLLVQTRDLARVSAARARTVTKRRPTPDELVALDLACRVCKHAKSNAIVFARADRVVGVGAGQMSRVDAARLAVMRAETLGLETRGAVVASDAFFPFRDGLDVAAAAGATAVIQPGGSIRDEEVIAAADEHGMAMVFTGMRHFRH